LKGTSLKIKRSVVLYFEQMLSKQIRNLEHENSKPWLSFHKCGQLEDRIRTIRVLIDSIQNLDRQS